MGRKIRVFISSTMKDLANERAAVRRRLEEFNFEPVNAENLGPTGANSWDRLAPEIQSCDLLVLLMGERYGWIPPTGPEAQLKRAITEREVDEAKRWGIPVLPFLKRLDDDADRTSDDAKKRDEFRTRIKDSDSGQFIQWFNLAADLEQVVGRAVIGLLSDEYQKRRIAERAPQATRSAEQLSSPVQFARSLEKLILPPRLLEAVREHRAVLFAGSGISLAAGLPSTAAFSERLAQLVREAEPEYAFSPAASAFAAIATDLETLRDRRFVTDAVRDLVQPPQNPGPTVAHLHAVRLFPQIITTNLDRLFERAAQEQQLNTAEIAGAFTGTILPERTIVKFHGSFDRPESLVITERDIAMLDKDQSRLWSAVVQVLREKTVIVVGSSLRDPSIVRLFAETGDRMNGFMVSPAMLPSTVARVRKWGLECIESRSDDFLVALAESVPG
jgi:hypothetical protein